MCVKFHDLRIYPLRSYGNGHGLGWCLRLGLLRNQGYRDGVLTFPAGLVWMCGHAFGKIPQFGQWFLLSSLEYEYNESTGHKTTLKQSHAISSDLTIKCNPRNPP